MATRLSWVAFSNLLRKSKIFLIDTLSDKSSFLIRASLEMALNYFVSKQAPFEKNKSHTSIRHGRNQTCLTVLPLHTIHHFATFASTNIDLSNNCKGSWHDPNGK